MTINAPASKVWAALTKPELIKQYLFDTEVTTDWRVGSPIAYNGEWEGKAFQDKDKILKFQPEKTLVSPHWSPLSGVPDTPENYHTITYELTDKDGKTEVTISQDNNASQKDANHSTTTWKTVLDGMKKLLES